MSTVSGWKMRRERGAGSISQYQHHGNFFFPSSPERQLSNSIKCVKPNLYFLTGHNIWVLNKEERINVWPSLKEIHLLGLRKAAMGAQHSKQKDANILGVTHMNQGFQGCPPPQVGIKWLNDNRRLDVTFHSTILTRQWDTEPGQLDTVHIGEKADRTSYP